ncbi:MAG: hypothetical protein WC460_04400 [Patescibacteria group bacterium]
MNKPGLVEKVKNGYIALISLIIIGAIVLISVLALTFITISQTQNMISQNQSLKSYYLANACAHYAILQLQDNVSYGGNETIEVDSYNCQVEQILDSGNANRIINTSSNVASSNAKIQVIISQLKPRTIISSWQQIY